MSDHAYRNLAGHGAPRSSRALAQTMCAPVALLVLTDFSWWRFGGARLESQAKTGPCEKC
jgi:hypothetical protein